MNSVTASGNAKIDTAQSKFGGASLLLDGTGDYLVEPSMPDSLHPHEQRFLREFGATFRNGLAVIGGIALVFALVFGWHIYKALVFYHMYLNGQ